MRKRFHSPGLLKVRCQECGRPFMRKVGSPGRPQELCSDECRRARDRARKRKGDR